MAEIALCNFTFIVLVCERKAPGGQKKAISKVFETVNNDNHLIRKIIMNLLSISILMVL